MDERAKEIARYFTKYNYRIKGTGEVITFAGNYQSSASQAASLTLYTLIGEDIEAEIMLGSLGQIPWKTENKMTLFALTDGSMLCSVRELSLDFPLCPLSAHMLSWLRFGV